MNWAQKRQKPRCIQTIFAPLYTLNMPGRPVPAQFARNEPQVRFPQRGSFHRTQYNPVSLDQLAIVGEHIIAGWMHRHQQLVWGDGRSMICKSVPGRRSQARERKSCLNQKLLDCLHAFGRREWVERNERDEWTRTRSDEKDASNSPRGSA